MLKKLGRKPRGHANLPHFSQMRKVSLRPDIPLAKNWLNGMPDNLGMMMNDQLGCCSIAGLHHFRQVCSFNTTGVMVTDPDQYIKTDYEALCGYVDGDPSTDQGAMLQDVLTKAMFLGLSTPNGKDKPLGFVEIDPRVQHDVREVIALGGAVYLGIEIPEIWTEMHGGSTWDVVGSPIAGGHCIIAAGYDADGFDVVSWGMRFKMTNMAFARYCDEAYWVADSTWVAASGATPGGISLSDMKNYMQGIKVC